MGDVLSPETLSIVLRDKAGVELSTRKVGVTNQCGLKRDVAADAPNHKPIERLSHLLDCIGAIAAMHDQLGDHRVVKHRDFAALVDAGIDAHTTKTIIAVGRTLQREHPLLETLNWGLIAHQSPCRRQEIPQGILRIDPALNRPPVAANILLRERELFASSDPNHLLDQIQSSDAFRHRMFNLQAGIHFQKVEVLVLAHHKLNRACALVLNGFGQGNCLRTHRLTGGLGNKRRRRLLDHLLVAALNRTFPLVQVHDIAMGVTEDLNLDVTGLQHVLFDKHPIITKAVRGLVTTASKPLVRFLVIKRNP